MKTAFAWSVHFVKGLASALVKIEVDLRLGTD